MTVEEKGGVSRRAVLTRSGLATGTAALALGLTPSAAAASPPLTSPAFTGGRFARERCRPACRTRDYQPVVVPNGTKCPWKIVGGAKVFHLVCEEFEHEFAPGLTATCWGYNRQVNGPVLEMVEGDRVRVYVTNRLPEATTVHWHGFLLPNGMDGVGGLTQKTIAPGETYLYEFVVAQSGTLLYHSHHDEMTQMALGLTGMVVVHPRGKKATVDRDFALLLHEWRIDPGASRPDPNEMTEFNVLTINGRCFPGTAPLVAKTGQRVRLRLGNLGAMDHHPFHVHGHFFTVTETDGGAIPASAQAPETTVLVGVGQTRTVELVTQLPGDWAMHCHMTHHVMNQMGHGLPNMIGVDAAKLDARLQPLLPGYMTMGHNGMGDMASMPMGVPANSIPMVGTRGKHDVITMGGMFTVLKVRDRLESYQDPGWYENPPGTLASVASGADLQRDGIDPAAPAQVAPGEVGGLGV
ncbi:MAG: copper oxidase [Archangiaceae bacterium]|nr:copper oxidase [Archangiaceae bacterium]